MNYKQSIICVVVFTAGLCGCTNSHLDNSQADKSGLTPPDLSEQWGIEVQRICLSAEGYMLDFRYQVVDPLQAEKVLARNVECYLIDQKSGTKMIVPAPPKVGSLRQKTMTPEQGRIYYVMFANPGRKVQRGDKVTVVIDDLHIPDLEVQ